MHVQRGISFGALKFDLKSNKGSYTEKLKFFTYSREAIIDLLRTQDINDGDEVLVPKYICSTVVSCIILFTKRIKFYNITYDLKYSIDDITGLLTSRSRVIFFVDYFGVETVVKNSLLRTLKSQDIIIVKDASHAFLTEHHHEFRVRYDYDYLISSIYKNLPMQVGAVGIGKFTDRSDFISLFEFLKRLFVFFIKLSIYFLCADKILNNNMRFMKVSNEEKLSVKGGPNIAHLYRTFLSTLNFEEIICERKSLTNEMYHVCCDRKNFRSVFSEDEITKNVLQDFPICFESIEKRDEVLEILMKKSIDAYTWPTFHPMCCDSSIWERILVVPIDRKVLKILNNV